MNRKCFLFIAAMLICGSMIAQENHYQLPQGFQNNIIMIARVCIDGVEQTSSDIEIGAFEGDAVRGSAFVEKFGSNNYYRANLTIVGNTSSYAVTFKLYNHDSNHEEELVNYTITDPEENPCEGITWQNNDAKLGTYAHPYTLNFVHTYRKDIAAGQWYFVSSPIGTVSPDDVYQMTPEDQYALYFFDQNGDTESKEWINYKGSTFDLDAGKGYLYANQEGCTLIFTGPAHSTDDLEVGLVYNDEADLPGYNLIGNPYSVRAYFTEPRDFYVIDNGSVGVAERTYIEPMEGVLVVAENGDDDAITFTTEQPTKGSKGITLNISQNRGSVIDRAIVRMGEGRQLPKFQLFGNNTKLYIPQGNQDYAVVQSAGQGELPVNFRAAENGTYTININAESVDMNYLHLIDNMTGMDVDLLQTPSYTFEANTTDYESRFKLVFAANGEDGASTGSATFAFYSNGNWIINNPSTGSGPATLQILDVNGHILCNEQITGCCSKSFEAAPGVYMLRLINGDNVKVQKVVVR